MDRAPLFRSGPDGLHYAVRILLGTVILWGLLGHSGDSHAAWAVVSLIIVTEPRLKTALVTFRYRVYNTVLGCGIGLAFLLALGPRQWMLPVVVTSAVLIATRLPQSPTSWRIAPITSILVLTSSYASPLRTFGVHVALQRTGEVLLGGAVALAITWLLSRVWAPVEADAPVEEPVPPTPARDARTGSGL